MKLQSFDTQRPSSWVKFKKTLCESCFAGCCTLPLEVSVSDLIRMGLASEEEAAVSIKAIAKRLIKERIVKSFNHKNQIFLIEQRSNNDCIFLGKDTRLCTVYDKRPEVCRQFPKIGPRPGFCPYKTKTSGLNLK